MTRVAAAIALVLVLLAAGCGGGKPARSAAEVIPASAVAVVSLPPDPEQPISKRALTLLPGGARLQGLLDTTGWARAAGERVEVALLPGGGVAFVEGKLDHAFALPHLRIRGWSAFALRASLLDQVKHAKHHLADATWYAHGLRDLGSLDVTAVWRDVAFGVEGATARRATSGGGTDATPALAARIPADAVAAAAGSGLQALAGPVAPALRSGVGLPLRELASAAPGEAAVYVRSGSPVPPITLLASGASLAPVRAVVRDLAGGAPPTTPATLDGRPASLVSLTALDLWYGRAGGERFLTDDPAFTLDPGDVLQPAGLPDRYASFLYLDVPDGVPALRELAALAATHLSGGFLGRVAGLSTVLSYGTRTASATRLTIVVS